MPLTHGIINIIILCCVVVSPPIHLPARNQIKFIRNSRTSRILYANKNLWLIYILNVARSFFHFHNGYYYYSAMVLQFSIVFRTHAYIYSKPFSQPASQSANKPFSHHSFTLYIVVGVERVSMIYWRIDDVSVIANILHCNHIATIDHLYADRPQYAFAK